MVADRAGLPVIVLAGGGGNQPAGGGRHGGLRRPGARRRAGPGGIPVAPRPGGAHAGRRDGDHGRLPHPGAAAQPGRGPARGRLVGRHPGAGQREGPRAGPPPARHRDRAPPAGKRPGKAGRDGGHPGPRPARRTSPLPGRAGGYATGNRGRRRLGRPGRDPERSGRGRGQRRAATGQRRARGGQEHRPGAGPANWLDALLPHFADPAVGAVAPRIVPHEAGRTWLARYEGASSTLDMGRRPSIVRPGSRVPYVPGAALVVRKQAAGIGFAEDMPVGEDVDFVWRLGAAGSRVRYEPAAAMGHEHRVRLRQWFARRKDYGTSAATLEQRHPGAVRPLYASAWTAAAWLAAAFGHPEAGAVVTGTGTALLARRLAQVTGEAWHRPAGSAAWRLAVA